MYKLKTKDGCLYYTTFEEAKRMQKLLGGIIKSIH